jgi:hypothetical protein
MISVTKIARYYKGVSENPGILIFCTDWHTDKHWMVDWLVVDLDGRPDFMTKHGLSTNHYLCTNLNSNVTNTTTTSDNENSAIIKNVAVNKQTIFKIFFRHSQTSYTNMHLLFLAFCSVKPPESHNADHIVR